MRGDVGVPGLPIVKGVFLSVSGKAVSGAFPLPPTPVYPSNPAFSSIRVLVKCLR